MHTREPEAVATSTLRTVIRAWLVWDHNQGHSTEGSYHRVRRILEDELAKHYASQP